MFPFMFGGGGGNDAARFLVACSVLSSGPHDRSLLG